MKKPYLYVNTGRRTASLDWSGELPYEWEYDWLYDCDYDDDNFRELNEYRDMKCNDYKLILRGNDVSILEQLKKLKRSKNENRLFEGIRIGNIFLTIETDYINNKYLYDNIIDNTIFNVYLNDRPMIENLDEYCKHKCWYAEVNFPHIVNINLTGLVDVVQHCFLITKSLAFK